MLVKMLRKNDGIALVTALMLTLISLVMIMALMFVITKATTRSGATKRYRTAIDASYGGAEVVVKDVIPLILKNYSSTGLVTTVQTNFSAIDLAVDTSQQCLQAKLATPTAQWPVACSQDPNPKKLPDLSFSLQSATANPYTVYTKIIDTVQGNSDLSGLQLEGSGVAGEQTVITPSPRPYIYRIEVQGEKSQNASEKGRLSVLYAY